MRCRFCNDAFWFQFDLFRIHPNSKAFLKATDLTEVSTFWRNDTVLAIVTRGKNGSDFNDLPGKKYSTWRTSCHSITRLSSYVFIANEAIIFKNLAFLHCCAAAFQWLTVTMTVTFDKCTALVKHVNCVYRFYKQNEPVVTMQSMYIMYIYTELQWTTERLM